METPDIFWMPSASCLFKIWAPCSIHLHISFFFKSNNFEILRFSEKKKHFFFHNKVKERSNLKYFPRLNEYGTPPFFITDSYV